jgi:hypothetical protein
VHNIYYEDEAMETREILLYIVVVSCIYSTEKSILLIVVVSAEIEDGYTNRRNYQQREERVELGFVLGGCDGVCWLGW